MNPVFLDTVGLIAIWDTDDQWHSPANEAYHRLLRSSSPLLTTTYVLLECGNASARRPYRARVNALRTALAARSALIEPDSHDIESAWAAYDRGEAGTAGIVDHVSFQVMKRLGLTRAFTHNSHFRLEGFDTLF